MPDDIEETEIVGRPSKAEPFAPGDPVQGQSVTGRPNDNPVADPSEHADASTFAGRKKLREQSEKRIASAENKAVQSGEKKAPARKRA